MFIKTNENLLWQVMKMREDLIEPERIKAIQEQLIGFLLDEVINPKGEFWVDTTTSVGLLDKNGNEDDEE